MLEKTKLLEKLNSMEFKDFFGLVYTVKYNQDVYNNYKFKFLEKIKTSVQGPATVLGECQGGLLLFFDLTQKFELFDQSLYVPEPNTNYPILLSEQIYEQFQAVPIEVFAQVYDTLAPDEISNQLLQSLSPPSIPPKSNEEFRKPQLPGEEHYHRYEKTQDSFYLILSAREANPTAIAKLKKVVERTIELLSKQQKGGNLETGERSELVHNNTVAGRFAFELGFYYAFEKKNTKDLVLGAKYLLIAKQFKHEEASYYLGDLFLSNEKLIAEFRDVDPIQYWLDYSSSTNATQEFVNIIIKKLNQSNSSSPFFHNHNLYITIALILCSSKINDYQAAASLVQQNYLQLQPSEHQAIIHLFHNKEFTRHLSDEFILQFIGDTSKSEFKNLLRTEIVRKNVADQMQAVNKFKLDELISNYPSFWNNLNSSSNNNNSENDNHEILSSNCSVS